MDSNESLEPKVEDYFRIVWKRKGTIILFICLFWALSEWYTYTLPRYYQTQASMEVIEKTTVQDLLANALFQRGNVFGTYIRLLKGREVIRRTVLRSLEWPHPLVPLPSSFQGTLPDNLSERMAMFSDEEKEKIFSMVNRLRNALQASQDGTTNIIHLTYITDKKKQAAKVLNTVCEEFINWREKEESKWSRYRLRQLKKLLRTSEEGLFRQIDKLNEASNLKSKIAHRKEGERNAQIELKEISKNLKEVSLTLKEFDQNPVEKALRAKGVNIRVRNYQSKLIQANDAYSALKQRYTRHPNLGLFKQKIQVLTKKIKEELTNYVQNAEKLLNPIREEQKKLNDEILLIQEKINGIENPLILQERLKLDEENHQIFQRHLHEIQLRKQFENSDRIRIVDRAVTPQTAISPNRVTNILIGFGAGLITGLAVSFILESLDTSLGKIEEIERLMQVPVLGVIPTFFPSAMSHEKKSKTSKKNEEEVDEFERLSEEFDRVEESGVQGKAVASLLSLDQRLITFHDSKSPVSEAFRTFRTNLIFQGMKGRLKNQVILFTSAGPQEGKSIVISNLAIVMAQMGNRTLVISGNLRRPSIYKLFSYRREPGLSDVLIGRLDWHDALISPGLAHLTVLPAGAIPPNPSELLVSSQMGRVLREVREEYDIVLMDSPPILPVTDAPTLSTQVDGTVIVYHVGRVGREALVRAKDQITKVGGNVWGIVLNNLSPKDESGYAYYYHYYRYYGQTAS